MADWPTHARKATHKTNNRRRTIAELAKDQLQRERACGVRS